MERVDHAFVAEVSGIARKDGKLWLTRPGEEEPVAVTVRYLRPLSARREIVFLDEKQQEVLTARGVEALKGEERGLVEEALAERYHLVVIRQVAAIDVRFGTRYCKVETDRGPRWFALREPGKNVTWLSDRHLVLRDTAGNRFEIPDIEALDARSRRAVDRSL